MRWCLQPKGQVAQIVQLLQDVIHVQQYGATYSCACFWPNTLKQISWAQSKTQHPLMGPVLTHLGLAAQLAFTTAHQNLQVPWPRPMCDRHERIWRCCGWTIKSSHPLSEIVLVSWALSSCCFKRTSSVQQECIGSSRVMTDINTINYWQPFTFSRPKSNWEPLGCVSESEAIK